MWRIEQSRRDEFLSAITTIRQLAVNAWGRWVALAHVIGNFQARLLLSVFYFVVLPPFALAIKLWKDPLRLTLVRGQSGWTGRPAGEMPPESWRRQF